MTIMTQTWTNEPIYPELIRDQVLVWRISLPEQDENTVETMRQTLSKEELLRLEKLTQPLSRRNFIICRALMRKILTHYLRCENETLDILYNEYGKPYINSSSPEAKNLHFNLSHSGDIALFAICLGAEVGIDIERRDKQRDALRLAHRFFHPGEYQALKNTHPMRREFVFIRAWTRKEAFAKAIGTGLQFPFSRFQISLDESAKLLWVDQERYYGPIALFDIPIAEPYLASLAILSQQQSVVLINWSSGDGTQN